MTSQRPSRGKLKVYLGFAPGVGKTVGMLEEAHELHREGRDVVVGLVEDHGRPFTKALTADLETIPRAEIEYRGSTFAELDVDAVLARNPQIVVVDELAHTAVPGSREGGGSGKRWEDVERILDHGIDVLSTLNIQHLESLNDVVAAITGVRQRETVPDRVLREADDIELVDLTPEALRTRLQNGNVYKPERVDAALSNYFRLGNLRALRELALLWLADQVEDTVEKYRAEKNIDATWPTRERIVVAVTGGIESEALIRRAMRIVGRTAGRELVAVYVVNDDGLVPTDPATVARLRDLVESLGGTWHTVVGSDVAEALLAFARGVNATQLVLGVSRRNGLQRLMGPGVGTRVINGSADIDVHMVTHRAASGRIRPGRPRIERLGTMRSLIGWALAIIGSPFLTLLFLGIGRHNIALSTTFLGYIALVVAVALVGGLWPALVTAIAGSLLVNWFFTPPVDTFTIQQPENLFAFFIFVAVAAAVAWVVDVAARRARQARQASSQATILSDLASGVLREGPEVQPLLERLREMFAQQRVTLVRRSGVDTEIIATAGSADAPIESADERIGLADGVTMLLHGSPISPSDRAILEAFAGRITSAIDQQKLADAQRESEELAAATAMRTALLAAVSHDLRTPIAGIKASVTALRMTDIELSPEDQQAMLETAEESIDRLDVLVENLLDMSRLATGALTPSLSPIRATDAVEQAIRSIALPETRERVDARVSDRLPPVMGDVGLLERVLANLIENAGKHAPESPIEIDALPMDDRLVIRVIDHGPGVARDAVERIFQPFQRLGDAPDGMGVGLGLAVARGLTEAMGGTIEVSETPAGGLTVGVGLAVAKESE